MAFYNDIINGIKLADLVSSAFVILKNNLERYGNTLSEDHTKAVHQLLILYTQLAQGEVQGRYAFPLFTGGGKTQSIVAWLTACHKLEYNHIAVAVCASKVEALCDLKRDLIKAGIPEGKIGLIHSYYYKEDKAKDILERNIEYPGYASLPCTDTDRPILLVTHNRVRNSGSLDEFNDYQGKPRNLLLWDESLLVSETVGLRKDLLLSGLGYIKPLLRGAENESEAIKYAERIVDIVSEKAAQAEEGKSESFSFPKLTNKQVYDFKKVFKCGPITEPIRKLIEISQNDLRIINTGNQGTGVITYDIVIPNELSNIVILDASHNIRKLVELDESIKVVASYPKGIVSYKKVTFNHIKFNSGRSAIAEEFCKRKDERLLIKEYVHIVTNLPKEEGLITFVFKDKYDNRLRKIVRFQKVLLEALEDAGIKTDALITVPVWKDGKWTTEEKPRFCWLSHGSETSLSKFSYCKNVFFMGILNRGHIELASKIAGQKNSLLCDIPNELIQEVHLSEICYCLHQGTTRTACRIVKDGVADAANVWATYHQENRIREPLESVMQDIQWNTYKPVYLEQRKTNPERFAEMVQEYLKTVADSKLSVSKLKKALCIVGNDTKSFTRGLETLTSLDLGWRKEGRSLIKIINAAI